MYGHKTMKAATKKTYESKFPQEKQVIKRVINQEIRQGCGPSKMHEVVPDQPKGRVDVMGLL